MNEGGLARYQTEIVKGAIDLNRHIGDIMIPAKSIFSLRLKKKLSNRSAKRLAKAGYSRIPIYHKKEFIIGVLLIKSLIGLDLSDENTTIEDLVKDEKVTLRKPIFTHPDEEIGQLLMKFKNGRSHMAIVSDDPEGMEDRLHKLYDDDSFIYEDDDEGHHHHGRTDEAPLVLGLVTIEDILELIINDEIYDEADYDRQNNPNMVKLEISVDKSVVADEGREVIAQLEDNYKKKV